MMNGADLKKVAIKAKEVAQVANGNGQKKRRKGQDLKPIITPEQQAGGGADAAADPAGMHAPKSTYVGTLPSPLPSPRQYRAKLM